MEKYLTIQITEKENGRKLLNYLKNDLGLSGLKIGSVKFAERGLLVDDVRVTVAHILRTGEVLKVLRSDSDHRERHLLPCPMPLDIRYEDDCMLVLNKPAGVVCHPSRGHLIDSLSNGVRYYFDETEPGANVHLIGRLDKDTSGALVMAKDGITADRLKRMKEDKSFEKTYLALAEGILPQKEDTILIRMAETRTEEGILKIRRGEPDEGKPAETHYRVISEHARDGHAYSLLSVTIPTGRMHQIRFHMAEIGHPLLGDALYGSGAFPGMDRAALHAASLTFPHPYTGKAVTVEIPLPGDMSDLVCAQASAPA